MSPRTNWFVATVSTAFFVAGLVLSHRVEPGVRVKTVALAGNTPALEFLPAGLGPHPIALLAHGYSSSKEALFCYGEALAAAGFECFAVDLPGHGASPRPYSFMDAVRTVEEVAREVGPVDVFLGHSNGVRVGAGAVRDGGMRPSLFIAVGGLPGLGQHGPPLLLLAGRFDEFYPPASLKARTDARLVLSPWSDHTFEAYDPLLVTAAVKAACAAVGKTPPAAPTCWRWRLAGMVLAMLGALGLAFCLPKLPPRWAWARGLLVSDIFIVAFVLTTSMWLDVMPHLRHIPLQIVAAIIALLVLMGAGRLRIPRWSFFVLAAVVAIGCVITNANILVFGTSLLFVLVLPIGMVLGGIATHRGSRLDGDIAMAIIVGCALCLWHKPPTRDAPPPVVIKLDAKLYNACVGHYEFAPDAVFPTGMKLTIRQQGDQLVGQVWGSKNLLQGAFNIYPESETNFLCTINGAQFTFIKNDKGEVTAVIHHMEGRPDSEGKKLRN